MSFVVKAGQSTSAAAKDIDSKYASLRQAKLNIGSKLEICEREWGELYEVLDLRVYLVY
jgi:hypothetical protein